jgi:hypothetical protein
MPKRDSCNQPRANQATDHQPNNSRDSHSHNCTDRDTKCHPPEATHRLTQARGAARMSTPITKPRKLERQHLPAPLEVMRCDWLLLEWVPSAFAVHSIRCYSVSQVPLPPPAARSVSASPKKRCLFLLAPLAMFVGRDSTNMGNAVGLRSVHPLGAFAQATSACKKHDAPEVQARQVSAATSAMTAR